MSENPFKAVLEGLARKEAKEAADRNKVVIHEVPKQKYEFVPLDGNPSILLPVCMGCGSVVLDQPEHNIFHDKFNATSKSASHADMMTRVIG